MLDVGYRYFHIPHIYCHVLMWNLLLAMLAEFRPHGTVLLLMLVQQIVADVLAAL